MMSYLHRIATAVPETGYPQELIGELMKSWVGGDRRTDRILGRIYAASEIEKRHSVVTDFREGDEGGFFLDRATGRFLEPGTGDRNRVYQREAPQLAACAAQKVMSACPDFDAADVSHVITVSCTGFFAPGPDVELVHRLGLRPEVERYHVGFMGCYGAFPALRMADAFCRADPRSVVLVVAVELCTLHLQASSDPDSLLAASVFADGAAAAIVSGRPVAGGLRIDRFASTLERSGEGEMAWTIGNTGFEMVLSSYVPRIVEERIGEAVAPLFADASASMGEVRRWAAHPGGRAILDKVELGLELPEGALWASREVLRCYGNMSSPSVLFVLERLMAEKGEAGEPLAAVAFGPGLSVESGLFVRE